ncbi:MAG TPA: cytochrome c [Thermoanaerobaculia bacterium]|jgi:mono/diheme cytochrome c family protein
MKTVLRLLGVLVVLVLLGLLFIFSGVYDVAANSPDTGLVQWVLSTTQARSVHRAYEALEGKVRVPNLDDPKLIQAGLVHYHEMCVTCHGAPGVKISEIGQGLNPTPPELASEGADEPLETYWIVKNGIKMTGMPSFGVTHTDEEIWAIVAFLNRMPKLSSQEYQAMARQAGLGQPGEEPGGTPGQAQPSGGHHHTHPPGTPPHRD